MSSTTHHAFRSHRTAKFLLALVCVLSATSALIIAPAGPLDHGTARVSMAATAHAQPLSQPLKEKDDEKSNRAIRGNLVQPLGWLAAMFMVSASLYYSAKRSVLVAVKAAEGPERRLVGGELRRALDRHIAASVGAVGIATLHVLNFFGSVRLTLGWVTLLLMLAVAASGVFGRFLAGAPAVRRGWRRFHLPLTYAFFAVLALHVFRAIELVGD